jgi:serine protease Do
MGVLSDKESNMRQSTQRRAIPSPAFLFLSAIALFLSGCVNPYIRNYQPAQVRDIRSEGTEVLLHAGEPHLVSSTDLKADALKMREKGYVLLGRSKFQASPVDENLALAQAKKIGAEVVMVGHKFVTTKSQTVPMSTWNPGQEVQQTERVIIQDGQKRPKVIERTVTTSTQGEYHTAYVEQNVDYFDYSASYWAKTKAPTFGVNVKPLDDALKSELGSNKGVLVRVVIKDSPAYDADILRGDVLLSLAKVEIRDPDHFFSLVERNRGKTVSVLLYRNGQNLSKDVSIHPN